jgi:hypothetical protein
VTEVTTIDTRAVITPGHAARSYSKDDDDGHTAEEFGLLEKLLKKASGELEGDAVPTFRIERVFVDGNTKTTPMLTDALIEKMVADADTMARKFVGVPVAFQNMIRKLTQAQTRLDRSDGRVTL